MSLIALPTAISTKRRLPWALGAAVVVAVVLGGWLLLSIGAGPDRGDSSSMFHEVVLANMDVTVAKDGELQAVNNIDIICGVEGLSTIQFIVKEGTFVKKDEMIVTLDSSELTRKLETAILELQKAESDLTAAREAREIQQSSNDANLESANVDLVLARLELEQYEKGTYPQDLAAAKRAVDMAKISVKTKEQTLAQSRALLTKGFVTADQVKTDEINLLKDQDDLAAKETALMVLEEYTHEKEVTDKRNDVVQAERKLVRVQRENASNMAQKIADFQTKEQALVLRKQQHANLKQQIENCTIKAPADGMVVYASSGSNSYRRESPIQAGAQVRQQELLIRLPDTSQMKAVARIPEQQAMRLRVDEMRPMRAKVKVVNVPEPITGWISNISVLADGGSRWWSPDTKEYPVDIRLNQTPSGLKPGMGAEVTIFIDRLENVLTVPLSCIYTVGTESYVFVRSGSSTTPYKVKLGAVNETHAQISEGLKVRQQVLILQAGQGRDLLERAGIKLDQPTTRPADADEQVNLMPERPQMREGGSQMPNGAGPSGGGRRNRGPRPDDGAPPSTMPAMPTTGPAVVQ